MPNPFVYGEVVPAASFVDREVELDRLTSDLLAGQKVFLISPRRYGKSSLVGQALRAAVTDPAFATSAPARALAEGRLVIANGDGAGGCRLADCPPYAALASAHGHIATSDW